MHEMPLGSGLILALLEQADLITDRRITQPGNAHAGLDGLRKGERREIVAAGLDHQADDGAGMDIQPGFLDQKAVHRRVEEAIIGGIIDVAVDVVIGPACRQGAKAGIRRAGAFLDHSTAS